jgi:hypothetical protein
MEHRSFDELTRTLSETSTRRRFGGILTALGLGAVAGLGLLGATETEAKKRHKKRHKKHRNRDKGNGAGNGGNGGGDGGGGTQPPSEPTCVPDCTGVFGPKYCGDDGCGGTCGVCPLFKPICNPILFTCETIV